MNATPLVFGCWSAEGPSAPYPRFADVRQSPMPSAARGVCVVIDEASIGHAQALLRAGAPMAFIAATSTTSLEHVARLAGDAGSQHVGVFIDAAPMEVRWHLDSESNADFRTLVPSMPEACWELLDARADRTGIRVDACLRRAFERGATAAIVRVELGEPRDSDLNVCAGLVERFGQRIWIAPRDATPCSLEPWIRYAGASRFVLPPEWHAAAVLALQAQESPHAA